MVVAVPLYRLLPLFRQSGRKEGRNCSVEFRIRLFRYRNLSQCPESEANVVASQTLLVYAPFAQRLNGECRSSPCIQMQSGSLVVVGGCRTVVFRQYVVSRGRPAPLDQACQSLVVCFLRSIDDRPSGLVDVVALERRWPSFWSRRRCFRSVLDSAKLEVLRRCAQSYP